MANLGNIDPQVATLLKQLARRQGELLAMIAVLNDRNDKCEASIKMLRNQLAKTNSGVNTIAKVTQRAISGFGALTNDTDGDARSADTFTPKDPPSAYLDRAPVQQPSWDDSDVVDVTPVAPATSTTGAAVDPDIAAASAELGGGDDFDFGED